jgi:uncharacterized FlaG/YvyC family protein
MEFYICYKGRRLYGPMDKDEATKQLFELRGAFKGVYVEIVDPKTGKVVGEIPKRKKN